jgi:hypothetical protein
MRIFIIRVIPWRQARFGAYLMKVIPYRVVRTKFDVYVFITITGWIPLLIVPQGIIHPVLERERMWCYIIHVLENRMYVKTQTSKCLMWIKWTERECTNCCTAIISLVIYINTVNPGQNIFEIQIFSRTYNALVFFCCILFSTTLLHFRKTSPFRLLGGWYLGGLLTEVSTQW